MVTNSTNQPYLWKVSSLLTPIPWYKNNKAQIQILILTTTILEISLVYWQSRLENLLIPLTMLLLGLSLLTNSRFQPQSGQKATSRNLACRSTTASLHPPQSIFSFLHQIPIGVLLLGAEAEILFTNTVAYKLLQRTEKELLGQIAFGASWQVVQADGTPFTDSKVLLQARENLVLGLSHPRSKQRIWLLVNTQIENKPDDKIKHIICTFSDITERQTAEVTLRQSQSSLEKQNNVLLGLARSKTLPQGNLHSALEEITEVAASTLGLERVSIWLYNGDRSAIECIDLYEKTKQLHTSGFQLAAVNFPIYFKALETERTIAADNAYTDVRTSEFAVEYLPAVGVTSMLDAPIWLKGEMIGVICHEHTGTLRQWTLEEQNFAGSVADLVTLAMEANERQKAQEALRQSEAKFHKLTANLPGMIYQFLQCANGSTSFPYASPYCWEIFEVEPFVLQQNADIVIAQIHPEDRQRFEDSVAVSAKTLKPWAWEGRFITPSRKLKWLSGASRPEKLENGDILWDGLLMDITQRKHTEAALQRAKDELEHRVEQRTKALKELNEQLLVEITERSAAQRAQAYLYTQAKEAAQIAQTRSHELQQTLEQLQKTQAQLVQSEKMSSLGNLVAGVAHEINNPISFISGNLVYANQYILDLLDILALYQQEYPQTTALIEERSLSIDLDFITTDLPQLLKSMRLGAERISQIVLSLRNFSRLDEAEMKCVNLHQGLDNALLILQHRLKSSVRHPQIEIVKEYGELPDVECYPGKLNQVFMNVLTNAIDAIEESFVKGLNSSTNDIGQIRIRTEVSHSGSIIVRIADNGSGMSQFVKSRVFDPFFTTKAVGSGTGLGLSISYQIVVENHKGVLNCSCESGRGAEFYIEIPISQTC